MHHTADSVTRSTREVSQCCLGLAQRTKRLSGRMKGGGGGLQGGGLGSKNDECIRLQSTTTNQCNEKHRSSRYICKLAMPYVNDGQYWQLMQTSKQIF